MLKVELNDNKHIDKLISKINDNTFVKYAIPNMKITGFDSINNNDTYYVYNQQWAVDKTSLNDSYGYLSDINHEAIVNGIIEVPGIYQYL